MWDLGLRGFIGVWCLGFLFLEFMFGVARIGIASTSLRVSVSSP